MAIRRRHRQELLPHEGIGVIEYGTLSAGHPEGAALIARPGNPFAIGERQKLPRIPIACTGPDMGNPADLLGREPRACEPLVASNKLKPARDIRIALSLEHVA